MYPQPSMSYTPHKHLAVPSLQYAATHVPRILHLNADPQGPNRSENAGYFQSRCGWRCLSYSHCSFICSPAVTNESTVVAVRKATERVPPTNSEAFSAKKIVTDGEN